MHANGGRGKGIVRGKHKSTPVLAAMIRCVLRAGNNIVPFQDVTLGWMGNDIRRRVLGNGFEFACQTLGGGFASHADDGKALGDRYQRNGTDCGSRESQEVQRRSSLTISSLRE